MLNAISPKLIQEQAWVEMAALNDHGLAIPNALHKHCNIIE